MYMRLIVIGLVAVTTLVPAAGAALAAKADGRLDIYWIDVEGGAATLLVTPQGESVLIDTGNPGHRDPDRIVLTAAKQAGLRQIDHVIITHYHADHFGGAAMLSTLMPIKHLHDNGIFEGIVDRPDQSYLDFKAGQRSVISPGDEIPLAQAAGGAKLSIKCIGARQKYVNAPADVAGDRGLRRRAAQADRHHGQFQQRGDAGLVWTVPVF